MESTISGDDDDGVSELGVRNARPISKAIQELTHKLYNARPQPKKGELNPRQLVEQRKREKKEAEEANLTFAPKLKSRSIKSDSFWRTKETKQVIERPSTGGEHMASAALQHKNCMVCQVKFSTIVRRTLCSTCSSILCNDCNPYAVTITGDGTLYRVRQCHNCKISAPLPQRKLHEAEKPISVVLKKDVDKIHQKHLNMHHEELPTESSQAHVQQSAEAHASLVEAS